MGSKPSGRRGSRKGSEQGFIVDVSHWSDDGRTDRRLAVPPRTTLDELAELIRSAFGWESGHLHEFVIDERHYGVPEPSRFGPGPLPTVIDAQQILLSSTLESSIEFTYDLARGIQHRVWISRGGNVEEPACEAASFHTSGARTSLEADTDELASITAAMRQSLQNRESMSESDAYGERCAGLWRECYQGWLRAADQLGSQWLVPRFVDVPVPSPEDGRRIGDHIVDWWPVTELPVRQRRLEKYGAFMIPWQTLGGTFHTCDLLWQVRTNPEASAAVFVAAFLWDILRDSVPTAWRGPRYELIRRIMHGVRRVLADLELPDWHHRHREALPVRLIDEQSAETILPRRAEDIGHLAAINAVLAQSTWQLVHVYHSPHGIGITDH